ncbi:hypothetical protein Sru01_06050 [Sphaerisporangium rufum]|uniref:Lipoprotein n=1 Tax=Sphaerisporangium rufum TaxID=1381558 RepID=A0A919QYH6_9ACTN|nr:hypothetical protein [Sphaerisporangium rufum]GII75623.1 hypothetical protein Sru01_06050 [Sphaerisporangium rufum]
MHRVGQVALAGFVLLAGGVACSAKADSAAPTPTPTASRQDVKVQLVPERVLGGATRSVRVRAFCPVPQGGTDYRATARSDAFTGVVTLTQPPVVTPAASSTPVTAAAPPPEVHGFAIVDEDAEPARYRVDVKCEGTNDTGRGTLIITARPKPSPKPTHTRVVPSKAPRAGGGGTAPVAASAEEPAGIPGPVVAAGVLAALAGGVAVARRRSRSR